MKKLLIGLTILGSMSSFGTENIRSEKVYSCEVYSNGELYLIGEGRIVIDKNVVIEEESRLQFSTARVLFTDKKYPAETPIVMNLYHIPESGNLKSLNIGYSKETHLRHRNLDSYNTWKHERSQELKNNVLELEESTETSEVLFSDDLKTIEEFETRQILNE